MAINIKFTKFDNTPWGFRLAGGSDFPQPLTVIRVMEESLAECMGLKVGDVVVRLNDQPVSSLTHGQAHEELVRAGNNFVLGVLREGESLKALEALSEDNIVPYKIPLADLPPVFPEQILKEEIVIEQYEETTVEEKQIEVTPEVEPLPDKPKDANSEIVPNQNLTDDEIAQLILEEEELLNDKGVLGVNFKKLKPRIPILKQSKVVEELQNIATEESPLVEQLRRTSVFLQKPQRPVPLPKKKQEELEQTEVESYKVVIKKQQRRSITDRLLSSGLLKPEDAKTPEPPTPEVNMDSNEPETRIEGDDSSTPEVDDSPCLLQEIEGDDSSTPEVDDSPILLQEIEGDDSSTPEVDDSRILLQEIEPIVVRSSPCIEVSSQSPPRVDTDRSLRLESPPTSVEDVESSKCEETVALGRRTSKRKLKRYYTKAHYFRKCFFGKRAHPDGKRAARAKATFRERVQESDQLEERPHREKSSRSRTKGRYLETYLKREDHWITDDSVSSGKMSDKLSPSGDSLRRTRYAEKILTRTVQLVAVHLPSDFLKYLNREQSNSVEKPRIRKRLYLKGRYFQRLVDRVKDMIVFDNRETRGRERRRSSGMIKMKGRYLEKFLLDNNLFDLPNPSSPVSSKRRFSQTRYGERVVKENVGNLYVFAKQVLQGGPDSSYVDLNSNALLKEDEGLFSSFIRSSKELVSDEVFHRGSRRLSLSRGSISDAPFVISRSNSLKDEDAGLISSFIRSSQDLVSNEVFHRGSRRLSLSRGSISDAPFVISKSNSLKNEEEGLLRSFIRSSKELVSEEVFHRGSRRLSRSRGSVSVDSSNLQKLLTNLDRDSNWFVSSFFGGSKNREKKMVENNNREGRRLSFVPTVLYEGLTNCIGVEFTRLVAYMFVPCTSVILLYMYNER